MRRLSVLCCLPVVPAIAFVIALAATQYGYTQTTETASVLSGPERALIKSFGPWPVPVPQDPGNELSGLPWAEQLGEKLFADTDLSGSRRLACISCHLPDKGFADGLSVAVGAGTHVRNTQGLYNAGLQRWFGWDGGADSLWAASLRPLLSELEMAASIDELAGNLRNKNYINVALAQYGDTSALSGEEFVVLLAKAIASYTRTIVSPQTEFDTFRAALLAGDVQALEKYSASALRGLKIFFGSANCHVCHFGANFSNGEFHDVGRPFFTGVGRVDPGRHSGIKRVKGDRYNLAGEFNGVVEPRELRKTQTVKLTQSNFGQWRTPSLRNLTLTAPYMHDGSLATLKDVVDYYSDIDPARLHSQGESILKPLNLDEQSRDDLVRFLETLSP